MIDSNKRIIRIRECSRITRASPSDYLLSYQEQSLGELNCRDAVCVFYRPSRLVQRDRKSDIKNGCNILLKKENSRLT